MKRQARSQGACLILGAWKHLLPPGIDHRPVVNFVFLREYSDHFQKLGKMERRKNSVAEIEEEPTERGSILMTM